MIVFAVLFVPIFITIFFLMHKQTQNKRMVFVSNLEAMGYTIIKHRIKIVAEAMDNTLYISSFKNGKYSPIRNTIKIKFDRLSSITLKLSKRGKFSQIFHLNKGNLPQFTKLNIRTNSPNHVSQLLEEGLLLSLNNLFKDTVDIWHSRNRIEINSDSIIIQTVVYQDYNKVIKKINEMIAFKNLNFK